MSYLAAQLPSGSVLAALAPILALVLGLVVYSLVDLGRRPSAPYLPKLAWVPIILLVMPWGAVVYLILGRAQRETTSAPVPDPGPAAPAPSPVTQPPVTQPSI